MLLACKVPSGFGVRPWFFCFVDEDDEEDEEEDDEKSDEDSSSASATRRATKFLKPNVFVSLVRVSLLRIPLSWSSKSFIFEIEEKVENESLPGNNFSAIVFTADIYRRSSFVWLTEPSESSETRRERTSEKVEEDNDASFKFSPA